MNYEFKFDELGRILLTKEMCEKLKHDGKMYIHIGENQILLNNNPDNAYLGISVDNLNRILIPEGIRKYKLLLDDGKKLKAIINDGVIVVPLGKAQRKANVRYVRKVDEDGRIVVPQYVRKKFGLSCGTHAEFIETENGFYLAKTDNENAQIIDNLGRLSIPKQYEKCAEIEIKISSERILLKSYTAK